MVDRLLDVRVRRVSKGQVMTWNILFLVVEESERDESTKNSSSISIVKQDFRYRKRRSLKVFRGWLSLT